MNFTEQHDIDLMQYIAKYNPERKGRSGNMLYEKLVDDVQGLWPWSAAHPASAWRERYVKRRAKFDAQIKKWQGENHGQNSHHGLLPCHRPEVRSALRRTPFSENDELFIVQYLAIETPSGARRMGNKIWEALDVVAETREDLNPHTWHSWREHYKNNAATLNKFILNYQGRYEIEPTPLPQPELWTTLPRIRVQDIEDIEVSGSEIELFEI